MGFIYLFELFAMGIYYFFLVLAMIICVFSLFLMLAIGRKKDNKKSLNSENESIFESGDDKDNQKEENDSNKNIIVNENVTTKKSDRKVIVFILVFALFMALMNLFLGEYTPMIFPDEAWKKLHN